MMTLIATSTVGAGGAASIDFTSIPATYTDLLVVFSARTNRASLSFDNVLVKFNGLSANFTERSLYGTGDSGAFSASGSGGLMYFDGAGATANTFGNGQFYIPNYAGSTNKSYSGDSVTETNAAQTYMSIVAGLWSQTAAITSISLSSNNAATIQQYSTASLYGIKSGSGGATVSP
jgi:hypothetical protein